MTSYCVGKFALIVDREEADNGLFSTKRTWVLVQKEGLQLIQCELVGLQQSSERRYIYIALLTGTGISPCHSKS